MLKNKKIIFTDLELFERFKIFMLKKYERKSIKFLDNWKLESKEKLFRDLITHLFKCINNRYSNDYNKMNDNLIDVACYCLFIVFKNLNIEKILRVKS